MGGKPIDLLQRVWDPFYQHGRVGEADRTGREPQFTSEDALNVASILKAGKKGHMMRGGQKVDRLVYYTSMDQAIREDPELQQLQHKYNASAAQMLAAAKHHDPDLVRRTVTYHPDFTAEQLADRSNKAADLLSMMPADPTARQHLLDRFMWADEASILLTDMNLDRVKVWCSKANFALQDIVSLPKMQGQKDCKVRFFIVVTSHPSFADQGGVVYWEYTSGTDNIKRRNNALGATIYEPYVYMVGTSALKYTILPYESVYVVHPPPKCCCSLLAYSSSLLFSDHETLL